MTKQITVIGCGVVGMCSGIRLLEAGFAVEIVADKMPAKTTSAIAAAIWLPFHVHPVVKVNAWAKTCFAVLSELSDDPTTGVYRQENITYLPEVAPPPDWTTAVPAFYRLPEHQLPPLAKCAYGFTGIMMESPTYLPYLQHRFQTLGGKITLLSQPLTDLSGFDEQGRVVVNCAGLASHSLCQDKEMYPIRGQLVRTTNPGLTDSFTFDRDGSITYVLPRKDDCILGGTTEDGVWDLLVEDEVVAGILERCRHFEPKLHQATILDTRVGLRPGRSAVRLETETQPNGGKIMHNYGHGGGGFTLSWGCADEIVNLVKNTS